MVKLDNFNSEDHDDPTDFDALPAGKYKSILIKSENKKNKNSNGSHIALTFQIVEGPYKGRNFFNNLNLENDSEKAVKIAKSQLASLCRATGKLKPGSTEELHDIPIIATLSVKKRGDGSDKMDNDLKKVENPSEVKKGKPEQISSDTPDFMKKS